MNKVTDSNLIIQGSFRFGFCFGKREGKSALEKFVDGDFCGLREAELIQDIGDRVADIEHEKPQSAVLLIGATAFRIGCMARTGNGGQWALDEANNFTDGNVLRGFGQKEATALAALAIDDAALAKLDEDLFEKRKGDGFASGDFLEWKEIASGFTGDREVNQCPEGIFTAFG